MILIAAQGVKIVISLGEGEGTSIVRVFADLQQLDDRFTADPGFVSTATGSNQLEEAVLCFN